MTKNKKKLADLKGLRDWDATEINMVLQIKDVTEFIEQHWDNLKEGFPSNLVYIKRKGNKIEIYPAALKTLENSEIDGNMGEIEIPISLYEEVNKYGNPEKLITQWVSEAIKKHQ